MAGDISPDVLEVISKVVDLTTQVALTNQNLSNIGQEVALHNKLIYGDEKGEGGLLFKINDHDKLLNDPQTGLVAQMVILSKHCNSVLGAMEGQNRSIRNLNKVVYTVAAVVTFILMLWGVIGYKTIEALLTKYLPLAL